MEDRKREIVLYTTSELEKILRKICPFQPCLCQPLPALACLPLPLHMPFHISLTFLLNFSSRKGWHYISFSNFGKSGWRSYRIKENLVCRGDSNFSSFVKIGQRNDRIQENLLWRIEKKWTIVTLVTLVLFLKLEKKVTGFRKIWFGEVLTGNQL